MGSRATCDIAVPDVTARYRLVGVGIAALILVGVAVAPLGGRPTIARIPITLAYRRALVTAGHYTGPTARVTVDARCENVSVEAFGSTWTGVAPWPATVTTPNPHAGMLRRSGFDGATFAADDGGRIAMQRIKHGYFINAVCLVG